MNASKKRCFVAIPCGLDQDERILFGGWFKEVIKPAIEQAGYLVELSTTNTAPTFITDEIRQHLVEDEMAVFDLGGTRPEDLPNPNVMYELGIRHAAGLPHVILAWKGQALPFDVSGQRVLLEDRRPFFFSEARSRLVDAIAEAAAGRYYRPMDAVERIAAIQNAATTQSADPIPAMATELTELRGRLEVLEQSLREVNQERALENLKRLLMSQPADLVGTRSMALRGLRAAVMTGNLRSQEDDPQ